MKYILAGLMLLLTSSLYFHHQDKDSYNEFILWKTEYGKQYTETQEVYRYFNYKLNKEKVLKHNSDVTQTYSMTLNQFSDLSQEEFIILYLFPNISKGIEITNSQQNNDIENSKNSKNMKSIDWRGITSVKDQGTCGGCWAFGAVGAAEGYFYIKNQVTVQLSEQQLIDCDTQSFGCNGGYQNLALKYIANNGLVTSQTYPYQQKQSICKYNSGPYKTNGAQSVSSSKFQQYLSEYPLVVLVDATNWQLYNNGIFNNCGKSVNHAVLAVGYDDDNNWFIKNSWGIGWGEKGFIRLASGNTCGVTSYAYRAI